MMHGQRNIKLVIKTTLYYDARSEKHQIRLLTSLLIFFNKGIRFCYKLSLNFFNWRRVYLVWSLEYLIKKPPVPTERAIINLLKVKSCNALLRMILVCNRSYLKSVLRRGILILDIYHPNILYQCE
jgi:hypothetical protein